VDRWEAAIAIDIERGSRGRMEPGAICHGGPVSISDISSSNYGLDLYSRFKFRPDFQAQKGLSTNTRRSNTYSKLLTMYKKYVKYYRSVCVIICVL